MAIDIRRQAACTQVSSAPCPGMADAMPAGTATMALLAGGVAAGPFYLLVGVFQVLIRPGFDPTRHDLSLMSNGQLGWIQIANFLVSGVLVVAGAVGMRRTLNGSYGGTWGPVLLGLCGVGLIGAGVFIADPAHGFPAGTPANARAISWHGLLHLVSGGLGFLALVGACVICARRFARLRQRGWAAYSRITGVLFFAAFAGIAVGSNGSGAALTAVTLSFTVAVVLGWTWIALLSAQLLTERSDAQDAWAASLSHP